MIRFRSLQTQASLKEDPIANEALLCFFYFLLDGYYSGVGIILLLAKK